MIILRDAVGYFSKRGLDFDLSKDLDGQLVNDWLASSSHSANSPLGPVDGPVRK